MGIRFAGHRGGQPYRRGSLTPQRASRISPLFPAPQGKEKTPI